MFFLVFGGFGGLFFGGFYCFLQVFEFLYLFLGVFSGAERFEASLLRNSGTSSVGHTDI